MLVLTLRPGRESSVIRRHPWLFSGAVAGRQGDGSDGLVQVRSPAGEVLAHGLSCPSSQIVARLWSFGSVPFDGDLIRRRFEAARQLRSTILDAETTASRLLHSEGDETPGLIADRYGDTDVLVLTAEGAQTREEEFIQLFREVFVPENLIVRMESFGARGEAGLKAPSGGRFRESGMAFSADFSGGQKTGFFLDQRENRRRVRAFSRGKSVLNLFSYSGAFSVAALSGGASRCVDVDSSAPALDLGRQMRSDNGFAAAEADFVCADVFEDLRRRVAAGERWDIVVCDPPAFAKKKADVDRAARGYKDVLRLSMALVQPGGILLACSCSGLVSADLFQKILFSAALDSETSFQILERAGAGADHPVSIYCPESEYLKAFFLRRIS